jgi:hypothetical protein
MYIGVLYHDYLNIIKKPSYEFLIKRFLPCPDEYRDKLAKGFEPSRWLSGQVPKVSGLADFPDVHRRALP